MWINPYPDVASFPDELHIGLPSRLMDLDEVIEYEHDALQAMDSNELLIQLIALRHLDRPNRENILKARELQIRLVAEANHFIEQLETLEIPILTDPLRAIVAEYLGGGV